MVVNPSTGVTREVTQAEWDNRRADQSLDDYEVPADEVGEEVVDEEDEDEE
jgi:hypothetical protein